MQNLAISRARRALNSSLGPQRRPWRPTFDPAQQRSPLPRRSPFQRLLRGRQLRGCHRLRLPRGRRLQLPLRQRAFASKPSKLQRSTVEPRRQTLRIWTKQPSQPKAQVRQRRKSRRRHQGAKVSKWLRCVMPRHPSSVCTLGKRPNTPKAVCIVKTGPTKRLAVRPPTICQSTILFPGADRTVNG